MQLKKILAIKKIEIKAQQATPAPPVGPQVGQYGINIAALCKEFNDRTKHLDPGAPVPTLLTIYQDKSFTFILKTLPTSYLIRKHSSKIAGKWSVYRDALREVAREKLQDLTAMSETAALKTIEGTARSMNLTILEDGSHE